MTESHLKFTFYIQFRRPSKLQVCLTISKKESFALLIPLNEVKPIPLVSGKSCSKRIIKDLLYFPLGSVHHTPMSRSRCDVTIWRTLAEE